MIQGQDLAIENAIRMAYEHLDIPNQENEIASLEKLNVAGNDKQDESFFWSSLGEADHFTDSDGESMTCNSCSRVSGSMPTRVTKRLDSIAGVEKG